MEYDQNVDTLGIIYTMSKQTALPLFIEQAAESPDTEFKSGSQGRLPEDIGRTISAYANTNGGRIIFGVSPAGERIALSRDDIDKLQQDILSLCAGGFSCEITPDIEYSNDVLVVYIPPSPGPLRPVYIKKKGVDKGTFVRVGSSSVQANHEWIQRLTIAARGGAESITYPEETYEEIFDTDLVADFIDRLNEKKNNVYQNFTPKEVLVKQRALDKSNSPTLFGIVAFGKEESPQEVIAPTLRVVITRYPGLTKVNEDNFDETYIDSKEFSGNVKNQFEQAFAYLKSILPIRGVIGADGKRQDYLVVPDVALRESLANAIAHRDYATYSSSIQVDIYSDRIEIINPGTSLVPIEELDTAPSTARNPLVMGFLKVYNITDQKARGIRTIKASLKDAGLKPPSFNNVGHSFVTTLHISAFISDGDREWLKKFDGKQLNERQLNALVYVKNNPDGIANAEYRNINSMTNIRDDKKANKELRHLVKKEVLRPSGENRARRYVLNENL